jgi:hypothetical protein
MVTNTLEINSLEQENFSIEDEGVFLVLPFKTIDRGKSHVTIDPGDNLNIIEYILTEPNGKKYPVELDNNLRIYLKIILKRKINQLKTENLLGQEL